MNKTTQQVKILEKKNKINSWLEISCEESPGKHIKNMLNSMQDNNRILYLEDEKIYIYNTISLNKLKTYLSKNNDQNSIIKILKKAIEIQENCLNYLIPTECIIFELNHSFINSKNEELEFIIIPTDTIKMDYSFKKWVCDLVNFLENELSVDIKNFTDKIFQQVSSSNFCLANFKEFLIREENKIKKMTYNELNNKTTKENSYKKHQKLKSDCDKTYDKAFLRKESNIFIEKDNSRTLHIVKNEKVDTNKHIYNYKDVYLNNYENKNQKSEKSDFKFSEKKNIQKTYIPLITYQIMMLTALFFVVFYANQKFINPKKAIAGAGIIWLLINYFISKEIIKIKNKYDDESDSKISLKKIKPKQNKTFTKLSNKKQKQNYNHNEFEFSKKNKKNIDNYNFQTEVLHTPNRVKLCLQNSNNLDLYKLDKKINLIGRKHEDVDVYIEDKSVGRIHAAIIIEDDKVYLKDNSSLNGCYINEQKIPKNCKEEIKIGDEIIFSNSKYKLISKLA